MNVFGTEHDPVRTEHFLGGVAYGFEFANGYGASVIRHSGSYGNQNGEGLWEMASLQGDEFVRLLPDQDDSGIQGWLTEDDVAHNLRAIETFPESQS